MNKFEIRSGICPTLNKNYSVTVERVDASTLDHVNYIDGIFNCEYASQHDCPSAEHCPVAKISD